MTDLAYTRRPDSVVVNNCDGSWDITKPSDPENDPTTLWLRLPDTTEGIQRLMRYDWDQDAWADVTPE